LSLFSVGQREGVSVSAVQISVTESGSIAPIVELQLPGYHASGDSDAPIVELQPPGYHASGDSEQIKKELARELHDQVAQNLTALLMQTQVFVGGQQGRRDVVEELAFVQTSVREVLNNVRQLVCDLRGKPGLSDDLIQALKEGLLPTFRRRTGLKVRLWSAPSWPVALPPETCIHLYRIVQEALINAHKHSGALNVHVTLKAASNERFVISIRDDGHGLPCLHDEKPVGMGILGMSERASLLGGTLAIRSRPMGGTAVTATIPKEAMHWSPKRGLSGF
jgi:signal transduction histidine kinase